MNYYELAAHQYPYMATLYAAERETGAPAEWERELKGEPYAGIFEEMVLSRV